MLFKVIKKDSQTFTIHKAAGKGACFFNSSLPLPPASQTLRL